MTKLKGTCYCGNIHLTLTLSEPADAYHPRACDCDFCQKQNISYISDPKGTLSFEFKNQVGHFRQGSESAEFLFCKHCSFVVGVTYQEDDVLYGAVNSEVINGRFGEKVTASPKKLSKIEKTTRWKQVWFSNVSLRAQV
ncbi:GFA family protein [Peredibacter starrii]|uniref:CENP-V/GFA domain-containing protein n=1 Tax=Peredibacter starrii TaxID=28202 RepID=A0AAX4HLK9_9BACT|nr:hypothetical protein [Peredibacter starrii]WPU64207.1 hypothetical protein SOO65_16045 [Peredibacter starrii]